MILNPDCDLRTHTVSDWGRIFMALQDQWDPVALEARRCILYQLTRGYVGLITIAMTKPACELVDRTLS